MKQILLVTLILSLSLLGMACGKKGDPVPQDQKNQFSWDASRGALTPNACLVIAAQMRGAVKNVDNFSIELEPLAATTDTTLPPELQSQQDTCEGCPFVPKETAEITPQETTLNNKGARYDFTYCPRSKAAGYRWRLVARSVFRAYPYQLTPIQTVR